jgi:hypothetical protein
MTLDDEFPELCMDDEFPETQPVVESDGESTSSYVNRCFSCNTELNCEEAQFCGGQGCLVEQQETPRDSIHASLATGELAVAKFFRGCPLARVAAFGADPIATAPEQEQEQPEQQGAEGEEQGQGYLRFLQEGGRPWGQEQEQHQPLERVPFVILEERARERRVRSEIVREQESRGATGAEADHLEWTTVAIYHDFDLEQQEQRDEVMPTVKAPHVKAKATPDLRTAQYLGIPPPPRIETCFGCSNRQEPNLEYCAICNMNRYERGDQGKEQGKGQTTTSSEKAVQTDPLDSCVVEEEGGDRRLVWWPA